MKRAHLHENKSIGERVADFSVHWIGSWYFIIVQACLLTFWFCFNTLELTSIIHFDPYPYILCNLFMSAEAAFSSPLILMSQNRQAERDRMRDDIEAREVQQIYESHDLLIKMNRQQLIILKQQQSILKKLEG